MGRRLWTDGEVHLLLDYLGRDVQAYTAGVKERFYASAKKYLDEAGHSKSASQIKTKLGELESSYKAYKMKLAKSGFGVKASDPTSIKGMSFFAACTHFASNTMFCSFVRKKCPYFYEIDEVFGSRHNITPPVVMEPGRTTVFGSSTAALPSADAPEREPMSSLEPDTASETAVTPTLQDQALQQCAAELRQTPPPATKPSAPKRVFSAVHPSNLHDALMQIHQEKSERREKRYKREIELQEEQIALQTMQLQFQKEELRLREKKMDQQFTLLCKKLELERQRFEKKQEK